MLRHNGVRVNRNSGIRHPEAYLLAAGLAEYQQMAILSFRGIPARCHRMPVSPVTGRADAGARATLALGEFVT
jgi:hypothetical protein